MSTLLSDLRLAIRLARTSPGLTLVAVLTLALAIGANAAIFSIVEAVLLRPLPFADPDRIVMLWNEYGANHTASSPPDYADRRDLNHTLDRVAAYRLIDVNLTGGEEPRRVSVGDITASFFDVVGRQASLGRVFTAEEDTPGRNGVVVLDHGFWQRAFGGRGDVLGDALVLNGVAHTVVGVMPPDFALPAERVDLWRPLALSPAQLADDERGNEFLRTLGRTMPGVGLDEVEADMDAIAASVLERVPDRRDFLARNQWGADAVPLLTEVAGDARPALLVLAGAVGLVLVVACANLANLLLVRGSFREREMAVRAALGASRVRLARQLVTESLLMAATGGAAGVVLAGALVRVARTSAFGGIPRLDESAIDWPVLAFTAAVSLAAALVFGVGPALHSSRAHGAGALTGARASDRPSRRRTRAALVAAEVGVAAVVLVGAGLLVRSFDRLVREDPGFETDGRFTARVALPFSVYAEPSRRLAFHQALVERLEVQPGVRAVGLTHRLPLSALNDTATFEFEGYTPPPGEGSAGGEYRIVGGDYFRAMGIRVVSGRAFDARDGQAAPAVAIIDEEAARRYFAGRDPIGRHVEFAGRREIVGVARNVRNAGLDVAPRPQLYVPVAQRPLLTMSVIVHSDRDASDLAALLGREVRAIDPDVPVFELVTLDERLGQSVARQRFAARLLTGLAAMGLLLAGIGIYGLLAFVVARDARQIGIRMALGATTAEVWRMVVGRGLAPVAIGLATGLAAAAALSRVVTSQLYGIDAIDPPTYAAVAVIVSVSALAACALPARRAAATDPAEAMRTE